MPLVQPTQKVYVVNGLLSGAQASNITASAHDTNNTSTVALGSGATFTGTGVRATADQVSVSCITDNTGTLYFDFSNDNTNWNAFPSAGFKLASGIHEYHTARVNGRYFRVRLVNDSGAQSYLRLYTYFGAPGPSYAPLNQAIGLDSDAILVRTTLPWLDIARGLATGMTSIKKFGRNPTVGTSYVPVCLSGNYRTPQAAAATALRIKAGGNVNDTAAGSGARAVTIYGTNENFALVNETLATAGASASSATTTTFTRVFRAIVSSSGTYASTAAGSHAAAITIENAAGGTDWFTIGATGFPKAQSEIGAYTIPSGKTGYVKLRNVSIDSGKTVDLIFFSRAGCNETAAPYSPMRAQSVVTGVSGGSIQQFGETEIPYGPYTGPCDVGFMAKVGTGTASVAVEFEIFLLDE